MPNTYTTLGGLFTAIANAIRAKKGTSGTIVADTFPDEIASITTGTDVSDANAVASDVASGKTFYAGDGTKKTGSVFTAGQGYIHAPIADSIRGYSGEIQAEKTLTSDMLFRNGSMFRMLLLDSNFKPENIKNGVTIFGVTGTYNG